MFIAAHDQGDPLMTDTIVLQGPHALKEEDISPGLDIEAEIRRLRREKNAVILAHYYQDGRIQDLADHVGDSLDLSRKAAETDADVIVFCGVRFMAEVAKILCPSRIVLLPDAAAGCTLEDSCQPQAFAQFRQSHRDHVAITYINCSAEVKAFSDIIVTSSNAEWIVRQIPEDHPILFAPDRHLGRYISRKTGRDMVLWPGSCVVHEQLSESALLQLMAQHPQALVAAHPECPEHILRHAHHVGSTRTILEFAEHAPTDEIIVATEPNLIHQMKRVAPTKRFLHVPGPAGGDQGVPCPFMAKNTMAKLYLCLVNGAPRVEMPDVLICQARKPLERMLDMSPPAKK
jgi:quinolinate synthase